jgi:transmembrane sensor
MNSENLIWRLIARSLSGEASQEEMFLMHDILKEDELLQQQYEILKQFWRCSNLPANAENEVYEKKISVLFEKTKMTASSANNFLAKSKRLRRRKIFSAVLGSVVILGFLSAGLYFFTYKSAANQPTLTQVVVKNGNRNSTMLPDGSRVWLNAGSVLSYSKDFKGQTRDVYLKGEAFFDVVKKSNQPFIVHANSVDIKVLGTAFNVKSYIEDNKVEATLIRGIIQVTRQGDKNQKPVFLHPNEKLVINLKEIKTQTNIQVKPAVEQPVLFTLYHLDSTAKTENLVETSWMYNRLEFRGDSFKELAKKLERWYNVKIIFEDNTAEQLSFNGSFENETIDQAFEALKAAAAFDYEIKENEIFVKSTKAIIP